MCIRRGLAPRVTVSLFSTAAPGSRSSPKPWENWSPTRPGYRFSTAQASVEVENEISNGPTDTLVSREDQHKEEKHRVRISDVSAFGNIYL